MTLQKRTDGNLIKYFLRRISCLNYFGFSTVLRRVTQSPVYFKDVFFNLVPRRFQRLFAISNFLRIYVFLSLMMGLNRRKSSL